MTTVSDGVSVLVRSSVTELRRRSDSVSSQQAAPKPAAKQNQVVPMSDVPEVLDKSGGSLSKSSIEFEESLAEGKGVSAPPRGCTCTCMGPPHHMPIVLLSACLCFWKILHSRAQTMLVLAAHAHPASLSWQLTVPPPPLPPLPAVPLLCLPQPLL